MIPQRHGGNLRDIIPLCTRREGEIRDFSVNTHPYGPHPAAAAAARAALEHMDRYPDASSVPLAEAVAAAHGLTLAHVVPGNGAAELIDLLPRALDMHRAVVVSPTFGEYADAVCRGGGRVIELVRPPEAPLPVAALLQCITRERPDAVFLCSPNNPTGERLPDAALHAVLGACAAAGTVLVLDEAFVEYDPLGSRINLVTELTNLVVLRSLTKFFGLAGLRVGYLAAAPALARRVNRVRPPWAVNGPAAAAAVACVGDGEYVQREQRRMAQERQVFAGKLEQTGLTPLPSDANFLLCRLPDGVSADTLYPALAEDGFLIRHCGSFGLGNAYIRLRVHRPEVNELLLERLRKHLATSLHPLATP
ncbi:MAG: threonine-phosphate decarboxylase CobD [Nitrospirota bacterium]|nr:threonine-phosphate decarboxylase CobD [Nitrospirota bacterium]